MVLTAEYEGPVSVTYQWKKDEINVGTGSKFTPTVAGSYTVTVSAAGYISRTSVPVSVPIPWTAVADSKFNTGVIEAITYGNGKFIAVGDNGKIVYLLLDN